MTISKKQQSLFNDLTGDFQIKKHSSFIQMQGAASLNQRKAMNGIIYIVKDELNRNPDQRMFTMDLGVLKKLAGIRGTDNSQFKKALRGLTTMAIEYNILHKDKESRGIFSFLSHAHIQVEERGKSSIIVIECPTIVLDAIRKPRMYSKLNLLVTRGIDSKHTLILYELMVDYIGLGMIRIPLQELRRLFGIAENQYVGSFSMFKKRILEASLKEINEKTDMQTEIIKIERIGRKVIAVTFSASFTGQSKQPELENKDLVEKLKLYGFSAKRSNQIIVKHDKEFILANIAIVEEEYIAKGKPVKSIPALLTTAFKSDFRKSGKTIAHKGKVKADIVKETNESRLNTRFESHLKALLQSRKAKLSKEQYEWFGEKFIDQIGNNQIVTKVIEKHGVNHPIAEKSFDKFLMEQLLTTEERDVFVFKKVHMKDSDVTR